MHTSILQKCVEELKKENPNISYLLGMLETVIEMSKDNETTKTNGTIAFTPNFNTPIPTQAAPEPTAAEKEANDYIRQYASGPIGNITNS